MQYAEIIEDIFKRHPSVQNVGFTGASYKAGIDSMREFDRLLGSPWKNYKCIHVAGTNGKGSVSSMIAVGLAASRKDGEAIGLYTSPHLLDFRERIKIISPAGGLHYEMIPKEDVMYFLEKYEDAIKGLSFFEITTGLALWWFGKVGVKAAVVETGLGGRLDSTNIIEPELSVITSIGLDHCSMLGNTRELIAAEKAGIFKAGAPALVWGKDEETLGVFINKAEKVRCHLYFADEVTAHLPLMEMDLSGEYQSDNLRTSLAALSLLHVTPDYEAINHTARISGLHGRWEIISKRPLTICDIGHNPQALAHNFHQLEQSGRKLHIVYGIMKDKDLESIAKIMPAQARYYLCSPAGERALPVDELYRRLREYRPELELIACHASEAESGTDCCRAEGSKDGSAESSVRRAVRMAQSHAEDDDIIYIGGSNFVVAEAYSSL